MRNRLFMKFLITISGSLHYFCMGNFLWFEPSIMRRWLPPSQMYLFCWFMEALVIQTVESIHRNYTNEKLKITGNIYTTYTRARAHTRIYIPLISVSRCIFCVHWKSLRTIQNFRYLMKGTFMDTLWNGKLLITDQHNFIELFQT